MALCAAPPRWTPRRRKRSRFAPSSELKKLAQTIDLIIQSALERASARALPDEPEIHVHGAVLHGHVAPPDHAVPPEQRERVVAEASLRRRRVGLESIRPAPEHFEAAAVPHDRIEGREQTDLVGWIAGNCFVRWEVPVDAVNAHMAQAGASSTECAGDVLLPLRHGVAKPSDEH